MTDKLRVLDLFSGIGGFSLGLERTGSFETVAFCEIEEYPRRVLAKHWPGVPIYTDVRELTGDRLRQDGIAVDVITGGFPCQDLSVAGKQAGIHGERSGLFGEIIRLAGKLRPRYIILENVAALLTGERGDWARHVFGQLAEIGFDAEWHVIPAGNLNGLSAGAPHRRERVWIVAYPDSDGIFDKTEHQAISHKKREYKTSKRERDELAGESEPVCRYRYVSGRDGWGIENVAYPGSEGSQGGKFCRASAERTGASRPASERGTDERRTNGSTEPGMGLLAHGLHAGLSRSRWLAEPGIGRVAAGVPDRAKKLKALGNSVVPQIPEIIGRAILEHEGATQ